MKKTITGKFTGMYKETGYGPRPIVEFDSSKPEFKNIGFNVFLCDIKRAQVSGLKKEDSESNNKKSFVGWVTGIFKGQECTVFLSVCSEDYDSTKKEYRNEIFSFEG